MAFANATIGPRHTHKQTKKRKRKKEEQYHPAQKIKIQNKRDL